MAKVVISIGLALVILGVGGYVGSGMASWTALIPAIPGLLFVVLGLMALRGPGARKHAMHIAAALAIIVALATAGMSIPKLIAWMGGTPPERPQATVSQFITSLLCLLLVILAVRSFIAARRARQLGQEGPITSPVL